MMAAMDTKNNVDLFGYPKPGYNQFAADTLRIVQFFVEEELKGAPGFVGVTFADVGANVLQAWLRHAAGSLGPAYEVKFLPQAIGLPARRPHHYSPEEVASTVDELVARLVAKWPHDEAVAAAAVAVEVARQAHFNRFGSD